jgi:proteasome assembly chaperone (PAC2) family protein
MDGGSITGMNGLIIGIAKLRGLEGTCLLGETSGYLVDAKASKAILESLLSLIGIKVDMSKLEKRAKDTEMLIQTIEQQAAGRAGRMAEGQQQPGITHRSSDTGYIS